MKNMNIKSCLFDKLSHFRLLLLMKAMYLCSHFLK